MHPDSPPLSKGRGTKRAWWRDSKKGRGPPLCGGEGIDKESLQTEGVTDGINVKSLQSRYARQLPKLFQRNYFFTFCIKGSLFKVRLFMPSLFVCFMAAKLSLCDYFFWSPLRSIYVILSKAKDLCILSNGGRRDPPLRG